MSATTQTQTADAQTEADRLAHVLTGHMTAAGIRSWMKENDLVRSRAARKHESVLQAFEQDPELVREKADAVRSPSFIVTCHCGHEDSFQSADEAEDAARDHKSANPQHFPKASDEETQERIYG